MNLTGDQEIRSVSEILPDKQGELAFISGLASALDACSAKQ